MSKPLALSDLDLWVQPSSKRSADSPFFSDLF